MSFATPRRPGVDRKGHRGRQEKHGGADRRFAGDRCATGPDATGPGHV